MSVKHPTTTTGVDHSLQAKLLETFDRFFSVASFYPVEHSQCQKAMTEFYTALDRVLTPGESIVLEPLQDGIRLQGIFLDQSYNGAQNLFVLLETLGLSSLKISNNAPLEELHSMVGTLNSLKLEASSFQSFSSLDFGKLPPSVRIEQRNFGLWNFQTGPDSTVSEKLLHHMNQLMDQVQQQSWSDNKKEEFRSAAESFMLKTIERMDTHLVRSTQSQRALEDVLLLGSSVVEKTISSFAEKEGDPNANQVLNQTAKPLSNQHSSEALEVLFEILKEETQNSDNSSSERDQPQPDQSIYSRSISDLTTNVMQLEAKATEPKISDTDYSPEILAITINMLSDGVTDGLAQSLQKNLAKQLSLPISKSKIDSLEKAINHLLLAGDRTPLDHLLPMILPHLLRNNSESLCQFFRQVAPADQPEKLAMVWPHLVGLMLLEKPPQNKAMLDYLEQAICDLPREKVTEEAHRLDFLSVIQKGKFGTTILQWPVKRSHGVLAALLAGRQSNQIGRQLNRFWMDKAPNRLAGVLMRVLGPYESSHQKLYTTIFEFSTTGNLDRSARKEISQLIHQSLEDIDIDDRNSGWVPHAVGELGNLGCIENQELLHKIVNQKRFVFHHAWPRKTRQAAQAAWEKISKSNGGRS